MFSDHSSGPVSTISTNATYHGASPSAPCSASAAIFQDVNAEGTDVLGERTAAECLVLHPRGKLAFFHFLLDGSGSTYERVKTGDRERVYEHLLKNIEHLVEYGDTLRPHDVIYVWTFNRHVRLLCRFERRSLRAHLDDIHAAYKREFDDATKHYRQTRLYDAIGTVMAKIREEYMEHKKADFFLVPFTHGDDNGSETKTLSSMMNDVNSFRGTLYTIFISKPMSKLCWRLQCQHEVVHVDCESTEPNDISRAFNTLRELIKALLIINENQMTSRVADYADGYNFLGATFLAEKTIEERLKSLSEMERSYIADAPRNLSSIADAPRKSSIADALRKRSIADAPLKSSTKWVEERGIFMAAQRNSRKWEVSLSNEVGKTRPKQVSGVTVGEPSHISANTIGEIKNEITQRLPHDRGQLEQVVENVEQLERKNVKEQSEQEIAKEQQEQVEENVEQFERKIVKQQLEQEIGKEEQEQKIVEDQRAQEILKEQQDQVEIDKEQLEQKIVEDERGQEIAKDHHEQGIVEEQQEHEENVKHQMEQEIAREQQEQGEIVKVQESEQIIVEHQREQELARDQHGMEIGTAQHEQGFVKEQQDHGKNVKDQMEQEIIKEQQEQAEIVKEQQSEQEMQLEQLGKGLVMNRRGCVEEEEGRRPWPGSKHFYNFLVIFNILLEPLSNTVASLVNQGRVSLGLLAIWLRIRAGTSDQFCHKGRVKSKDLILGRFLGQGCSGIFYETSWSGSHDRLARKLFPGVPSDVFASEVAPLVALSDHPNILKTLCWTVDDRSCSLVMEYVGDNLSNVVQKRKKALNLIGTSSAPFKMLEAMDIVLQIASGLLHLHKNDIVHGDLKPNNILIDEAEMLLKLGDFGLVETKRRTTLVSQRTRSFQMVEWSAPELMEDNTDDDTNASSISSDKDQLKMTDSYSFASICVYVLGGKTRNANEQVSIPSACPEALASLISMCWSAEPILRPDFSVICDKLEEIVNELKQQSGDRLVPSRNC